MIMGSNQPKRPVPAPNIMPKPMSQKQGVPMQKSIRFFIRMLPVFLARVKPASHMEKPACMKKTSAAPNRTQMVLTELNSIVVSSYFCVFSRRVFHIKEGNGAFRVW